MHEKELIFDENVILQILHYGNSHLQTKKDKWNGIALDESDSLDGILNVAPCPENIYENTLISTIDEWI